LSGQFFQLSLFGAVDAILGAIVTTHTHTHRNVISQPKYGQISNCGLTILIVSLFSLRRLRNTTQLRSATVDKSNWPVFLQNASGNPIWQPTLQRQLEMTMYGGSYVINLFKQKIV